MRPPLLIASCCLLLLVLLTATGAHAGHGLDATRISRMWEQYKTAFIQQDGRVIDREQNGISHSESQGYGLLLAVLHNDREMFERIRRWTEHNLQARKDGLLPWAWGKRHNGQWGIIDYNNATDGDLLVAFALIKGAAKWQMPEYHRQGLKLVEALRSQLTVSWQDRSYLLPAYYGFQKDGQLVLNPSYQIFAAYRLFAKVDDRVFWDRIHRDSLALTAAATFGTMQLPADWVALNSTGVVPWEGGEPLFGYEAIRVLLYLTWERKPLFPAGLQELFTVYQLQGRLPATINLLKQEFSAEEASAGFYAVCGRAAMKTGNSELGRQLWHKALDKAALEHDRYYSMSLLLLALHDPEP